MKQAADTRYMAVRPSALMWTAAVMAWGRSWPVGRPRALVLLAALEHVQHPVGHHHAADDVKSGEEHGHKGQGRLHGALRLRGDNHRAHQDDPVYGVAAGHERRMQDARDFRYHLKAQEDGENEDEQQVDCVKDHALSSSRALRVGSWCTDPATTTALLSTISSVKSGASRPSFTSNCTKFVTLRE